MGELHVLLFHGWLFKVQVKVFPDWGIEDLVSFVGIWHETGTFRMTKTGIIKEVKLELDFAGKACGGGR